MSLAQPRRAIGGDFELDRLCFGTMEDLKRLTRGLEGRWTTSGRGALALVLRELWAKGVRHIHLPAFLCESVLLPILSLGFNFSFYPVDLKLNAQPDPPAGSCVLVIHHFGWLNSIVHSLRDRVGSKFILIEDAAQALLSDWSTPQNGSEEALSGENFSRYVILSPRKFGPAALGGWCNVAGEPEDATLSEGCPVEVGAAFWRSLAARLARGAYLSDAKAAGDPAIEAFYLQDLKRVENFLNRHPTCTVLPKVVMGHIAGLDWQAAATRRRANWQQLQELLSGRVEALMESLPTDVVPLGFVVALEERNTVRERLAAQRIFCPVHWRLPAQVERARFPAAAALSDTCLTLPVDQRYGPDDISRMAEALLAAL